MIHQTPTNKNLNFNHQNRTNGTIKSTTIAPVGRNSKQFPASTTTKKYRRPDSTANKTGMFYTSYTTQKYTKINGTATKKVAIADDQKTTEPSSVLQTRFFIKPPEKKASACTDGLTRSANGDCVFTFSDD